MCKCFHVCMTEHYMCALSEGDTRSLGTGAIEGCESQCGCWELNLIPLEDRPCALNQ